MLPFYGPRFGNPSSVHRWGRDARTALDEARERVARCLGAHPDEICFTSGGTEADNLAILGAWRALARARDATPIVTTPIEHKAVLGAVHQAAHEGRRGAALRDARRRRRRHLVVRGAASATTRRSPSVMWVNNEIGTDPADRRARAARQERRRAVSHRRRSGVRQGRRSTQRAVPFDILTISGHKIGAPKGIGAVFIRRGTGDRAAVARRHAGPRAPRRDGERRRGRRPRARRRACGRRARGGVAASRAPARPARAGDSRARFPTR